MKKSLMLVVLLLFVLVSCAASQPIQQGSPLLWSDYERGVSRFLDTEANVVCYTWSGGTGVAISCVPQNQTTLGQ